MLEDIYMLDKEAKESLFALKKPENKGVIQNSASKTTMYVLFIAYAIITSYLVYKGFNNTNSPIDNPKIENSINYNTSIDSKFE